MDAPQDKPISEELPTFDPSMKKKKKKKPAAEVAAPVSDSGYVEDSESSSRGESEAPSLDVSATSISDAESLDDMSFGEKKKKKKKVVEAPVVAGGSWQDSDRDYDYFELLERMQKMLQNEGKSTSAFKDAKLRLPPPELVRDGTTKTVWTNFAVLCKKLHRSLDHMLDYTLAELGTNGSIDGSQRLTIRGRFQAKQVESVVRHYVAEFVKCNTCGSTETELLKENRMNFLHCNTCQSRRTVVSIAKGYVAQVRRRKKT